MTGETSPLPGGFVDYEAAADRFAARRSLDTEALVAWGSAVRAHLPFAPTRLRVLDLGSGTGAFSHPWIGWGASEVIAVEPSAAMRTHAVRTPTSSVFVVGGRAEALPMTSGQIDVAWLSTVIHHFADLPLAITELRRVTHPGSRVFIRGYFPDRSRLPWLDYFEPRDHLVDRFPPSQVVVAALERAGFRATGAVEVAEPRRHQRGVVARWIDEMRTSDSVLTAFSSGEIDAGIAALDLLPEAALEPVALTLLSFLR